MMNKKKSGLLSILDFCPSLASDRVTLKTEKLRIKRNGASESFSPISVSFRFVSRGVHWSCFVFRFGCETSRSSSRWFSFRFVSTHGGFRFVSFRVDIPRGFAELQNKDGDSG